MSPWSQLSASGMTNHSLISCKSGNTLFIVIFENSLALSSKRKVIRSESFLKLKKNGCFSTWNDKGSKFKQFSFKIFASNSLNIDYTL